MQALLASTFKIKSMKSICSNTWLYFSAPWAAVPFRLVFKSTGTTYFIKCLISVSIIAGMDGALAQPLSGRMREAAHLKSQFRYREALEIYERVVEVDPDNVDALLAISSLCVLLTPEAESDRKKLLTEKSRAYAWKAIAVDSTNLEGRVAHCIALGLLSQQASSPREKLAHAATIKKEAEVILMLNKQSGAGHYILGKWHLALSNLTWIEKVLIRTLYGGTPAGASLDKALYHMQTALKDDSTSILYLFGLGQVQHARGNVSDACATLKEALALSARTPEDEIRQADCRKLLNRIHPELK